MAREGRQRFELMQDSTGAWSVVDTLTGLPIEAKGKPLQGLDLEEAQQALFMANTGILRDVANRRRSCAFRKNGTVVPLSRGQLFH